MYFLATPHRGADSALLAKYINQSTGHGQKSYLEDLIPGNRALELINDDFRHVCSDLSVWSFTESVPTTFALSSRIVVDKHSAVIGIPREHIQYLEATHRNICKFDSPANANYLILQRALLTTIEDMISENDYHFQSQYRSQMKKIASLLRVNQASDATLLAMNEKQHAGTCQWLTQETAFMDWVCDWPELLDASLIPNTLSRTPPQILWLNGRPGTGKSVAAGHVIRYLQSCNHDCSFYFFKAEHRTSTTVAACLRSIAFQMAQMSYEIRRALTSMVEDDININTEDHHMLWASLFTERILKVDHSRPQFLVIDAVDECATSGIPTLASMLSSLDNKIPIKVFLTSRPGGLVGRSLSLEKIDLVEISTGQQGSLQDIKLFLEARSEFSGPDAGTHNSLVTDVLNKSNGIFLWASLTASKLEGAYSVEDKQQVLKDIPAEMDEFYTRILSSIVASPSAELVQCILKWAICSPAPLSMDELSEAIKLDLGRTLTASARDLESMTGHLLFVDKNHQIHVLHQTMAAFLTRQRDGFWIDRVASHSKLTEVSLTILSGNTFSSPRIRRGAAAAATSSRKSSVSPLSNYAARHFSYHLIHCKSADDGPIVALNKFLRSNVLTWIERVAATGDLSALQLASQRFKSYLRRRAKYQSSLTVEAQTISSWAVDIHHLVAVFHPSLLVSPSSIHSAIPHLCPPKSITRQLFAKASKKLRVCGPVDEDWSDRLTCHLFPEEATSAACGSRFHAIGLSTGEIKLYGSAPSGIFNCTQTLNHGKRVRLLAFDRSCSFLVSCSARMVTLWHLRPMHSSGITSLWSRDVNFTPSSVSFSPQENTILVTSPQKSAVISLQKEDGAELPPLLLHVVPESDSSDENSNSLAAWTPAESIALDAEHRMAALSFRNADVHIWDIEAAEFIGKFEKEGFEDVYSSPPALDMVFNPIPEVELLAIAYKDGDIVTCNPWTLDQAEKCSLPTSLVALAATSDGRVLAGGAEDGSIFLFLFETLQVIYQVARPDESYRIDAVVFFKDNLRFMDVRGQSCNIWEPSILVPKNETDDLSEPQSEEIILDEIPTTSAHDFLWGEGITKIEPATDLGVVFVGRQNGVIEVCDLGSSKVIHKIRLHSNYTILHFLVWNVDCKTLVSADSSGRSIVTAVSMVNGKIKIGDHWATKITGPAPISHVLLSSDSKSMLVCTGLIARVVHADGQWIDKEEHDHTTVWVNHPSETSKLMQLKSDAIQMFDWKSFERVDDGAASLRINFPSSDQPRLPWVVWDALKYAGSYNPQTGHLTSLDLSKLGTAQNAALPIQTLFAKSLSIQSVIGCLKSTLFFLDTKGWVCSVSLKNLSEATHFVRHFFIPMMWRTGADNCITIVSKSGVAFGRGEQLLLFHGFLDFEEKAKV